MQTVIVLGALLALVGQRDLGPREMSPRPAARPDTSRDLADAVRVTNCLVTLIEEAEVPAQEAGVLVELKAREGQEVAAGDVLAQIDDKKSRLEADVAGYKLDVAKKEAGNDINVRYSQAAAEVAGAVVRRNDEANSRVRGAVSQSDIEAAKLKWKEATLSIEKSQKDLDVAALQVHVSEAEQRAAAEGVARRQIRAPIDAVVVELHHHLGEWVQPGEQLLRVVRMNRLRVEGFLNARSIAPSQIDTSAGAISVSVELTKERRATFPGKIVFISPLVQSGGEYRVFAEVDNREENGHWVLRPGLLAEMTIRLKQ